MAALPKLPGIPSISAIDDPNVAAVLRPMRETLLILGSAISGKPLPNSEIITTGLSSAILNTSTGTGGYNAFTDYTIPPAPTGFSVAGAFATIILAWDTPTYANPSYVEIWRSSTNSLGTATLVGSTSAAVFSDSVGNSLTAYYWIRFVSLANVKGPYNATGGTVGATATNPALLIASLTNSITTTQLYTDLATTISTNTTQVTALNGQYTVKVDTNGYVSGFGLANTGTSAAPYSTFLIRADSFAIAAPGTSISPVVPFIVQTSTTTVNGVTRNPGVYIGDAYIADGTITNAKIANAAIDNAKISDLDASKINAGTISADRIGANSITAAKLASSYIVVTNAAQDVNSNSTTIDGGKITANSITASQIAAGTITGTQISSSTITGGNIASTTITGGNIATSTITADKISVSTLSAITANLGSITAGTATFTQSAGNYLFIDGTNQRIDVYSGGSLVVRIGQL